MIGNRTHDLSVYGTMVQPTEPGPRVLLRFISFQQVRYLFSRIPLYVIFILLYLSCSFFLRFLFIFGERGREGEEHQCVVDSHVAPTGDLAHNPGMCPDWESNQQPLGLLQPALSPLSYTRQGKLLLFLVFFSYLCFLILLRFFHTHFAL